MLVYRINPSGSTYEIASHPVAACRAWSPRGFGGFYIEVRIVTRQGILGGSDSTEIRVLMTDEELDRLVQALAEAKARE